MRPRTSAPGIILAATLVATLAACGSESNGNGSVGRNRTDAGRCHDPGTERVTQHRYTFHLGARGVV